MATISSIPVEISIYRIIGRLAIIKAAVPERLAKGVKPKWSMGILKKDVV